MNNPKYYIIKDQQVAITMETLLGRRPYIYPNKFEPNKSVYSFVNDAKFQQIFALVNKLIKENER